MRATALRTAAGLALAAGLTACAATASGPAAPRAILAEDLPVTDRPFANDPANFQFAVVGDRTGGHRDGVYARAMDQLNWLQPEFVLSVGDHIEGYTEDAEELQRQWRDVQAHTGRLEMPYFYVPGNHDISNPVMLAQWRERLGRDYYHFRYGDVLFLALSTEDPPTAGRKKQALAELGITREDYTRAAKTLQGEPDEVRAALAADPRLAEIAAVLRQGDAATISDAQVAYMERALADNADARWTVVLMHKPAWKYEAPNFERIEALLAERPYTMLAGHYHYYSREQRHGRDYIQLGTTGGDQSTHPAGPGTLDHIMWVTMTDEGPRIANIALDGLHGRDGPAL